MTTPDIEELRRRTVMQPGTLIVTAAELGWLLDEIEGLRVHYREAVECMDGLEADAAEAEAAVARLTAENAALREGLCRIIDYPDNLDNPIVLQLVTIAARAARLTEPKETENG